MSGRVGAGGVPRRPACSQGTAARAGAFALPAAGHKLSVAGWLTGLPVLRRGLHFLALMGSEEAEDCSGLWLLLDREPPTV